ncbi:EAL domain-containing protein [Aliikangiella coralliicola]|nr:EAL domain-containing protein [Aliikangiella coralliicola]
MKDNAKKPSLFVFSGEKESNKSDNHSTHQLKKEPWKVMIIDDDELVHQLTHLVLENFQFNGAPLTFIDGYSAKEAKQLIKKHPDTAVLLLDVVMENDEAGFDVVDFVRKKLGNRFVRIILRTGQPGQFPENKIISDYDINDYKDKTELTSERLNTTLITALRSYQDLQTIETLVGSKNYLEKRVEERTRKIMAINKDLKKAVYFHEKTNRDLAISQDRLAEAQKIAKIGHWEWRPAQGELFWSAQSLEIFSVKTPPEKTNIKHIFRVIPEDARAQIKAALRRLSSGKKSYEFEHEIICPNGGKKIIKQRGKIELSADKQVKKLTGTVQDITETTLADEQMRKLSGAIKQIAEAVIICDKKGTIEYVNPSFSKMTGYNEEEVINQNIVLLKSDKQSDGFYRRMWRTIRRGDVFSNVMISRKKDGSYFYEEKTITPQVNAEGKITHFISTGKDISERMEAMEKLQYLAHNDTLTDLPNRTLFRDRLNQAITRLEWQQRIIAVLFLDVDRFKIINDSLGHDTGDNLLREISRRLEQNVRSGDTVSRLGGDEFAILLSDISRRTDIAPIAEKLLDNLSKPYYIGEQELFVTISIGISTSPQDGEDVNTLIKKADVAMYQAKSKGKNNYQFYTDKDEKKAKRRLTMEVGLRRALEKEQFFLCYQPQVDIATNKVTGVESLLRWRDDQANIVSPFEFIPVLEDTGMITGVGEWVIRESCRQGVAWEAENLNLKVAVNISIRQLQVPGFVKQIETVLNETGFSANKLELELTENLLIEHIKDTSNTFHELHDLGIKLSIDDFGTGYSSMNYLKRLPFDTLKIDRAFIKDIMNDQDDAAIANAIITLAHSMDMEVVAEGVESSPQLGYLKQRHCDIYQGFLCSPPVNHHLISDLIANYPTSLIDSHSHSVS